MNDGINQITDGETLKAWLNSQGKDNIQSFAVIIARRAALRVLPKSVEWAATSDFARKRDLTPLPFLRCNLTASVVGIMSTDAIKDAYVVSSSTAFAFASSSSSSSYSASSAASAAAYAFGFASSPSAAASYAASASTSAASASTSAADSAAREKMWNEIQADCTQLQADGTPEVWPLWQNNADPLADIWRDVKSHLTIPNPSRTKETARGPVQVDWTFWINWYEGMLAGTPQNWEMLEQIAGVGEGYPIAEADWKAGPARIAELIAGVEANYESQNEKRQEISVAPSAKAKAAISQNIMQNKDALVLMICSLTEQLAEFKGRVENLHNQLDKEYHDELLEYLDDLTAQLGALLCALPVGDAEVSDDQAKAHVLWWRKFRVSIGVKAKDYIAPENVAGATLPTSVILGCTGVGAMVGGPVGAGVGGLVGKLITGELKPAKAAEALMHSPEDTDK